MEKRKKFDSDPLFSDKYLKTKNKSYNETINTSFTNIDNKSTKPLMNESSAFFCQS